MQPFSKQMTITRRIEISNLNVVTLNTTSITGVPAQLYSPLEGTQTASREAPTPYNLRYRLRAFGSLLLRYRAQSFGTSHPRLQPGDRVTVDAASYEVLTAVRPLSHGQRLIGYEGSVAAVSDLYPLAAELRDNEAVVDVDVPLALTPAGEAVQTDRGSYQDFDAESPADYVSLLTPGRVLVLGSVRYRIRWSEFIHGTVRLSVRRASG